MRPRRNSWGRISLTTQSLGGLKEYPRLSEASEESLDIKSSNLGELRFGEGREHEITITSS
jgi:hypothetical protein